MTPPLGALGEKPEKIRFKIAIIEK